MQEPKPRTLRVPVNLRVSVEHAGGRFQAVAVNLGLGGVFIEASPGLPYGERLDLIVELPGLAGPSRLAGVVRWSARGGFGVQFQQLGARETHAIGAAVSAYRKAELAAERRISGSFRSPSAPP